MHRTSRKSQPGKTYKHKLAELEAEVSPLRNALAKLNEEYYDLLKRRLDGQVVDIKQSNLLTTLVDGLENIRKQGGGYSSSIAVELLAHLGELK